MAEAATRSEKVTSILESVKTLNVMDLVELVKAMEEDFGVSATPVAAALPAGMIPGAAAAEAEPEKTSFDVILKSGGQKKIQVIKEVRALTTLGLKEAKELVDGAPKPIKEGISKEEAEKVKEKIEAAGGTVEIK